MNQACTVVNSSSGPNPHELHQEILRWFEEVQPDPDLRRYVQKLTGLLLTPDTNLQKVWIMSGIGRNGKSFFLNKVLQPAMGTFFGTGQTAILTRKRESANEANAAIVDLIGRRVAVFLEPASNEVIQADTLKLISGEDRMSVRGVYATKQQVFTPTFKAFICFLPKNDRPKMSEDSFAVWRRVRVIDWPITFTERPNFARGNERQLDPLLDEKVKAWPPFFAGLMVYWLKLYRIEGLSEPACVVQHTRLYEEEHDEWAEFRTARLVSVASVRKSCGATRLHNEFKGWCLQNGMRQAEVDRPSFAKQYKSYFEKHLGLPSVNRIDGEEKPIRSYKCWHLLPSSEDG